MGRTVFGDFETEEQKRARKPKNNFRAKYPLLPAELPQDLWEGMQRTNDWIRQQRQYYPNYDVSNEEYLRLLRVNSGRDLTAPLPGDAAERLRVRNFERKFDRMAYEEALRDPSLYKMGPAWAEETKKQLLADYQGRSRLGEGSNWIPGAAEWAFGEAEKRVWTPWTSAGLQTMLRAPILGGPSTGGPFSVGTGGLPSDVERGRPVNPVTALWDPAEQQYAAEVLDQFPLGVQIVAGFIFDPLNLLPIVGFGPELKTLIGVARSGKAGAAAAAAKILKNPEHRAKIMEAFAVALRKFGEERGGSRIRGYGDIWRLGDEVETTVSELGRPSVVHRGRVTRVEEGRVYITPVEGGAPQMVDVTPNVRITRTKEGVYEGLQPGDFVKVEDYDQPVQVVGGTTRAEIQVDIPGEGKVWYEGNYAKVDPPRDTPGVVQGRVLREEVDKARATFTKTGKGQEAYDAARKALADHLATLTQEERVALGVQVLDSPAAKKAAKAAKDAEATRAAFSEDAFIKSNQDLVPSVPDFAGGVRGEVQFIRPTTRAALDTMRTQVVADIKRLSESLPKFADDVGRTADIQRSIKALKKYKKSLDNLHSAARKAGTGEAATKAPAPKRTGKTSSGLGKEAADRIQDLTDFGEKRLLAAAGIEPSALDDPEEWAKLLARAAESDTPELAELARDLQSRLINAGVDAPGEVAWHQPTPARVAAGSADEYVAQEAADFWAQYAEDLTLLKQMTGETIPAPKTLDEALRLINRLDEAADATEDAAIAGIYSELSMAVEDIATGAQKIGDAVAREAARPKVVKPKKPTEAPAEAPKVETPPVGEGTPDADVMFRDAFEDWEPPSRKVGNKKLKKPQTLQEAREQAAAIQDELDNIAAKMEEEIPDSEFTRLEERQTELSDYHTELTETIEGVDEELKAAKKAAARAAKKAEKEAAKRAADVSEPPVVDKPKKANKAANSPKQTKAAKVAKEAGETTAQSVTDPGPMKVVSLKGSGRGKNPLFQYTTGVGDILKWRLTPEGELHIVHIFVPPEFRGQGRGYMLLDKMFEQAYKRGARYASADIESAEGAAILARYGARFTDQAGVQTFTFEQALAHSTPDFVPEWLVGHIDMQYGVPQRTAMMEERFGPRALAIRQEPILLGPRGSTGHQRVSPLMEVAHAPDVPEVQRLQELAGEAERWVQLGEYGSQQRLQAVMTLERINNRLRQMREDMHRLLDAIDPPDGIYAGTRVAGNEGTPRILPLPAKLADFAARAFGRRGWVNEAVYQIDGRLVWSPTRVIDPSMHHSSQGAGRWYIGYERMQEALDARAMAWHHLLAGHKDRGLKVFNIAKNGIEENTGIHFADLIDNEYWRKFEWTPDQLEWFELHNNIRLNVLEDLQHLGVYIPDAWKDADHGFRQVRSLRGQDAKRAARGGGGWQRGARKPSSFQQRLNETINDGILAGNSYNNDYMQVFYDSVNSMYKFAAETEFIRTIRKEFGRSYLEWAPKWKRAAVVAKAQQVLWTQRLHQFAVQSMTGEPAKALFKDSKYANVPEHILAKAAKIWDDQLIPDVAQRRLAMYAHREDTKALLATARKELSEAKSALKEEVNRFHSSAPGEPFGKAGREVPVGQFREAKWASLSDLWYEQGTIDYIKKTYRVEAAEWVKKSAGIADIFRTAATALDPGFWFLHGMGAMALDLTNLANPATAVVGKVTGRGGRAAPTAIWGKSVYRSLRAVKNPENQARFWRRVIQTEPDTLAEFMTYYRTMNNHGVITADFVGALKKGGILERIEGFLPGINILQPVTRAEAAFGFYLDSFAYEAWKALKPLAKSEAELTELGAHIRSLVGKLSTRGIGVNAWQRTFERAFISWAPSFTRGAAALMISAVDNPFRSFRARQAQKALFGLFAANALLGAGLIQAKQMVENGGKFELLEWEDLKDEHRAFWDITNPTQFWTTRIGDNMYGLGGPYRSNLLTGALIVKEAIAAGQGDVSGLNPVDKEQRFGFNWRHPLINEWRKRSSPLTGLGISVLSGSDYLGYSIQDPSALLHLGDSGALPLPFAVRAYIEGEGGFTDRLATGAAQWFGFRSYPVKPLQLYKEAAEEESGLSWQEIEDSNYKGYMLDHPEEFPKTAAAYEVYQVDRRKKDNKYQKAMDTMALAVTARDQQLETLAKEIEWSRPGGGAYWKDKFSDIMATTRNDWTVAANALGIDPEFENTDEPTRLAALVSKYYEIDLKNYAIGAGEYDWDAYDEDRDAALRALPFYAQQAIKDKTFQNKFIDEAVLAKEHATEMLREWYDAPKYKDTTKEESEQIDATLEKLSELRNQLLLAGVSLSRAEILEAAIVGGFSKLFGGEKLAVIAWAASKNEFADMVKSKEKTEITMRDRDLAVFYSFTYDALDEDWQQKWLETFGY